jgi:two-component system, OmpR family, response regulator MtrA
MSHILIADDDKDLVEGLGWYLEAEGFQVTSVNDGTAALAAFRDTHPDVVILDIMMPGADGIEVCETIRRESDALIMMLSARDGEIDKVRALSTGADDYVTKPFHVSELVARVKAMLRRHRSEQQNPSSFRWRDLLLLVDERRVSVGRVIVELTSMEFDLLVALMRRPRTVIPREDLIKVIWGDDFYGEKRLVDNHVYRLREKLTKAGLAEFPVATVRGVGYAFRPEE